MPNIDINIKEGDSLLNYLVLSENNNLESQYIKDLLFRKNIVNTYKDLLNQYKTTNDKDYKREINKQIKDIKKEIKDLRVNIEKGKVKKLLSDYISRHGFKGLSGKLLEMAASGNPQEYFRELNMFDETEKKESKKEKEHRLKSYADMEKKLNNIKEIESGNTFEWGIEFPEILDESGNFTGFDLIIGNPPYIQLQKDGGRLADLYNGRYQTLDRTGDIYCLFYEQGMNLLKQNGYLAYITSNKWMRAGYGEKLRQYLTNKNPLLLVDLGPGVFKAAVDTNIIIIQNGRNKNELMGTKINELSNLTNDYIKNNAAPMPNVNNGAWFIGGVQEYSLKEKIESIGVPLKDWDVKIYFGIKTGFNEAFIIDSAKKEEILNNCESGEERTLTELLIKPILRGRDIDRYSYKWANRWIIVIHAGWTNNNNTDKKNPEDFFNESYPSLYEYLSNYKENAKKRDDKGDYWWELRHCAYYAEFEKEKIAWQRITQQFNFNIISKNMYVLDSMVFLTGQNLYYIMGCLNSKLIDFYIKSYVHQLADTGFLLSNQYVEKIPIPKIQEEDQQPIIDLVDKIIQAKADNPDADTSGFERQIDGLVCKLYSLTEDEIELVEKRGYNG